MGVSSSNACVSGEPLSASEMNAIKRSWNAVEDKNLLGKIGLNSFLEKN